MAHRNIITQDNLKKKCFQLVNKCYLCNEVEKTIMHLLFQCSYSCDVWNFFISNLITKWVFPPSVKIFIEGSNFYPYSHNIIIDLWRQFPPFLILGLCKNKIIEYSRIQQEIVDICVSIRQKIQENINNSKYSPPKKMPSYKELRIKQRWGIS
jgi:hypothetical protein